MESTVRALLIAMSHFELWDDDVIDPDTAVSALESVSAELSTATPEEIEVISKVACELAEASDNEDAKEFFEEFVESFGLDE